MAGRMLVGLAESGCPIFRFTSPSSRGQLKSKGHGKLSIHLFSRFGNDWDLSHNCFCKAAQSFRSNRRNARILRNPSRQIGRTRCRRKNQYPHSCWTWSRQKCFWIVMTKLTSQQDKLSKFFIYGCSISQSCWNWTKFRDERHWRILHTFMQWHVVQTLFQEMKSHLNQKGGSMGTPKLGPYWKLQHVICLLKNELRTELSLWAETMTRGLEVLMNSMKFVLDFHNNDPEITEYQHEANALQLDAKDFVSQSKTKSKATKKRTFDNRIWSDVEPGKYLFSDHEVSKKWIWLLYHGNLLREDEGAVQFWRIEEILQKYVPCCRHWSDSMRKESMGGEGN